MLPTVDARDIERAVAEFNDRLRDQPIWIGWDQRANQKYALEIDGNRYPPKQIVSLATGRPVSTFTGGAVTNSFLTRLGFTIVSLNTLISTQQPQELPSFEINRLYSRVDEITGRFGGSGQSGISPSSRSPAVFLFTGGSGKQYGYHDHFDEDGCLIYTGEGQEGDMTLSRGNLAITMHTFSGRALHVFEALGKGKPCIYRGEFVYISHSVQRGADLIGNERDVIIFRLMPVISTLPVELGDSPIEEDSANTQNTTELPDLRTLRNAAIVACKPATGINDSKEVIRHTYQRSAQVRRYVLTRAQGRCELCEDPAPFFRKSDQTPYLEPHHINRVSDGGLDHPLYVGAICPTCHRRIHSGVGGSTLNEALREKVRAIEADLDGAAGRML